MNSAQYIIYIMNAGYCPLPYEHLKLPKVTDSVQNNIYETRTLSKTFRGSYLKFQFTNWLNDSVGYWVYISHLQ
jgi:hypothetical protein